MKELFRHQNNNNRAHLLFTVVVVVVAFLFRSQVVLIFLMEVFSYFSSFLSLNFESYLLPMTRAAPSTHFHYIIFSFWNILLKFLYFFLLSFSVGNEMN